MKTKEIEKKIKRAYTLATPNIRDSVLSSSETRKEVIIMTNNNTKKTKMWKKLTAYASIAAVFVFAVLGGIFYADNYVPTTAISIDVNPSIEIKLAKSDRVIDVVAHNDDGKLVLEGMSFKGADLDVTVNALIGSMLRHGYINELANSILVSVEGDAEKSALIREQLAEQIDSLLLSEKFGGSVLSQTVAKDDELAGLAEEHGISAGKAQLISDIITVSPVYTFSELAELSINELNIIAEKTGTTLLDHVNVAGSASVDSYIGYDAAKQAALTHAGLKLEDVKYLEAELDYGHGKMIYEVEFISGGFEYDYEINAVTGEVIRSEKDRDDDSHVDVTTPEAGTYVGRDAALSAAFTHAGVKSEDVKGLEISFDNENGKAEYEIEFYSGGYEYDYEIDALTGEVIKSEKEASDGRRPTGGTTAPETGTYVGREKALEAAYKHAGVKSGDVKNLKFSFDCDDGVANYEIEFDALGYEYDYDINAKTGEVIKSEKENDDDFVAGVTTPDAGEYIGRNAALAAALKHAGVKEADATGVNVEFDADDVVASYEVEFKSVGYEYDYDINAKTGEVIKSEKEKDDDYFSTKPAETTPAGTKYITRDEALAIAYKHAGVKAADAREIEAELDTDHGTHIYEIDFKVGGYEYEYEINAVTGSILVAEKEIDD